MGNYLGVSIRQRFAKDFVVGTYHRSIICSFFRHGIDLVPKQKYLNKTILPGSLPGKFNS
jgi:hypothetical protein